MKLLSRLRGRTQSQSTSQLAELGSDGTESVEPTSPVEMDFSHKESYHALRDHVGRGNRAGQTSGPLNLSPPNFSESGLDLERTQTPELRRSSMNSEVRRSSRTSVVRRKSSTISGVSGLGLEFMPLSLHERRQSRASLPPISTSTVPATFSSALGVASAIIEAKAREEDVDSPLSQKSKGKKKHRTSRRNTLDPEQLLAAREKMRYRLRDAKLAALLKRGSIVDHQLEDEETIRHKGLSVYELNLRALEAGATEEDVEVAIANGFDAATSLIKLIVEKEHENTPSLEQQAEEYAEHQRQLRKSRSSGCILSPESLAIVDAEKQAKAVKVEEERAIPCGFQKGDVVTTVGSHDEDGPWKDSGGVGVILGNSIHGLGFVDVLFDRTGDIFKIRAKNLKHYQYIEDDKESVTSTQSVLTNPHLLPALRNCGPGSIPSSYIKGVSVVDALDGPSSQISYF